MSLSNIEHLIESACSELGYHEAPESGHEFVKDDGLTRKTLSYYRRDGKVTCIHTTRLTLTGSRTIHIHHLGREEEVSKVIKVLDATEVKY